jgi:saccharopine dehydrogenase-like NADP-dependent oxidoreductase
VTGPCLEYLLRKPSQYVTVGSYLLEEAEALCSKHERATPVFVDVLKDIEGLGALIAESDIVVSLIPATMHHLVAEVCIKHKTNLVTASYVSPALAALDGAAKEAGICIMNEVGLDPGMDHLSAMRFIDDVKAHGDSVVSFESYCGGLPAPESANNALGYKFSWYPRGVLTAMSNTARFRRDGVIVDVAGKDLLASSRAIQVTPAFFMDQIPNRDSVPYAELYGVPDIDTMYRATLRYHGYCHKMAALQTLGVLSVEEVAIPEGVTMRSWFAGILGLDAAADVEAVKAAVVAKLGLEGDSVDEILSYCMWLNFFSDEAAPNAPTSLDVLCAMLMGKDEMSYAKGERDMALMQHVFGVRRADGKREKWVSTLVDFAIADGTTSMSRCVGLTCAMATQLLVSGEAKGLGVMRPLTPDWYNPILKTLAAEGITFTEERVL